MEIPCLEQDDLQKAQKYCETNQITGCLFDTDTIFGNEWYYLKGRLCSREKFEEIVYGGIC